MNLLQFKYDKYSCGGNDGIIDKIFEIIKISNGSFVEFGAWDGIKGCNSRNLFEKGWGGTFIEPNKQRYKELMSNYSDSERINCIQSIVDANEHSFDKLINHSVDFCSIDIDGLDVNIFESMQTVLPKVICMEGGQMLKPHHKRIPDSKASHNIQQSLSVIDEIAREKGYRIVCTYQDTFLVKDEYYPLFDVEEDINVLYMEGLASLARRLPWITIQLKKVGLHNSIIEDILSKCNYENYGWGKRKEWAINEDDIINKYINGLIDEYKNKKNS